LGTVIADLVNALSLPMYAVGGGVSAGWNAFAPRMFEVIRKRSFVYGATAPDVAKPGTIVTRAQLGGDAGILGAARLPMLAQQ
jgi:glucokinase